MIPRQGDPIASHVDTLIGQSLFCPLAIGAGNVTLAINDSMPGERCLRRERS